MSIKLKIVTEDDFKQIQEFKDEMQGANSSMDGTSGLQAMDNLKEWYQKLMQYNDAATCPKDKSPLTQYIIMDDERLVGMLDIRHNLNHPMLKLFGGNIGYSIRPSERRKGYAKEGLRLALLEAEKLGINNVMISCLVDNTASRNTILELYSVYMV